MFLIFKRLDWFKDQPLQIYPSVSKERVFHRERIEYYRGLVFYHLHCVCIIQLCDTLYTITSLVTGIKRHLSLLSDFLINLSMKWTGLDWRMYSLYSFLYFSEAPNREGRYLLILQLQLIQIILLKQWNNLVCWEPKSFPFLVFICSKHKSKPLKEKSILWFEISSMDKMV